MDTENFKTEIALPDAGALRAKATRRRYAPAFKQQVIDEVFAGQASVSIIARRYDLNANLVFRWKREYQRQGSGDVAGPKILPIHVVRSSGSDDADEGRLPARIEIRLRAGRMVIVHGEVSNDTLRTVLETLR